jgi:hypothetical protein
MHLFFRASCMSQYYFESQALPSKKVDIGIDGALVAVKKITLPACEPLGECRLFSKRMQKHGFH